MESGDIGEIGPEKIGKLPTISIDSKGKIVDIPQEGIEIETTAIFNKDDQVKLEFGNKYGGVWYDNGESVNEALDYARALKGSSPLDIASKINDWISGKSLLADHPEEIQKLRDPSSSIYNPELADWVENNITRYTKLPISQEKTSVQEPIKLSEIMTKTNKEGKFYGVCKHTTVLGTAMLQEAGIPAWIQGGVHTFTDAQQELHAWIVFLNENRQLVGFDPSSRTADGKGILSTNYPDIFDKFAAFVDPPNASFKPNDSRASFSIGKEFENSALARSVKALTERTKLKLSITPNKPFKGTLSGTIDGGVGYDPHKPTFPYKIVSIDKVPDNLPFEVKFGDNLLTAQKRPI